MLINRPQQTLWAIALPVASTTPARPHFYFAHYCGSISIPLPFLSLEMPTDAIAQPGHGMSGEEWRTN
jgi:hypothetical protein